jgi:hypothetical protein
VKDLGMTGAAHPRERGANEARDGRHDEGQSKAVREWS